MSEENEEKGKSVRFDEMFEYPVLEDQTKSPIIKLAIKMWSVVDTPVDWVRVNIVERFRGPKYNYYHQKFRRVPTIDQCYTDDQGCIFEANSQYKRDKKVDENILNIVRRRFYNCVYYERGVNQYYNHQQLCLKERAQMVEADYNYFIKYGDIGPFSNVVEAFRKQQHRLIWERRQALKEQTENES